MTDKVTTIKPALSIREQAEAKVRAEQLEKHTAEMVKLLREKAAAEQVLRGIELKITDLEQRIQDGTA